METTSRDAFILFLRIALKEVSTVTNRLPIRIEKAAKRTRLVGRELELIAGARKKIRLNQTIPIESFIPKTDPSKVPILEGSRPPALRSHKLRPKLKIIDRAVANAKELAYWPYCSGPNWRAVSNSMTAVNAWTIAEPENKVAILVTIVRRLIVSSIGEEFNQLPCYQVKSQELSNIFKKICH